MKENDQSDYEKKLNMIIEERLTKMESPDYKFAARFSRRDYLITAAIVLVCLAFVLLGAYIK